MRAKEFEAHAIQYLDGLYRYGLRLARNPERAEDLVQETFARAIAHVDRIATKEAIRPTLAKIMHNLFVDEWRAVQRGPVMISTDALEDGDSALPLVCPAGNVRETMLRESLSDEVERAMHGLADAWRETIWLREIEGFSYEEISSITNVPVGTVRSRLARARRALADQLEDYARDRGIGTGGKARRGKQTE